MQPHEYRARWSRRQLDEASAAGQQATDLLVGEAGRLLAELGHPAAATFALVDRLVSETARRDQVRTLAMAAAQAVVRLAQIDAARRAASQRSHHVHVAQQPPPEQGL